MDSVIPLARCELAVRREPWGFALSEASRIARFWARAVADKPALYNGTVYMLTDHAIADGVLSGVVQPAPYAAMLYWKDQGAPGGEALNAFGSGVIMSREGHLLFGHMAAHTAAAGRVYPVGGSFSDDDVVGERIDVEANIAREFREETGLDPARAAREPGYLAVIDDRRLSLTAIFRFDLPARELKGEIVRYLEAAPEPELDDIVVFRRAAFHVHHRMPGYARRLVQHLLD